MIYTCDITIDLPRQRVTELFDDPDSLKQWQPGLASFEHLSGEPGQPGAKSRLIYEEDGRHIEMVETVTKRELPKEFTGTYETNGVVNRVKNTFHEVDATTTRWVAENEFRFSGFMRVMAFFMRGAFKKRTMDDMRRFKNFAEQTA